jgi:catechol 2,3-dioxygenase-like lactoylglutathione lyase family enzyme
MIGTNDLPRAQAFYDAVLGTLGVAPGHVDRHRVFWRTPTGVFSVSLPIDGQPATVGNGSTLGFALRLGRAGAGLARRRRGPRRARPARTRRACAKARAASSTWPTCATPTATRSAGCTAMPKG